MCRYDICQVAKNLWQMALDMVGRMCVVVLSAGLNFAHSTF